MSFIRRSKILRGRSKYISAKISRKTLGERAEQEIIKHEDYHKDGAEVGPHADCLLACLFIPPKGNE